MNDCVLWLSTPIAHFPRWFLYKGEDENEATVFDHPEYLTKSVTWKMLPFAGSAAPGSYLTSCLSISIFLNG
jgi:hypothetical protein